MKPLKLKSSYTVLFSPDGASCLTAARNVGLWDLKTRKKRWWAHPFSHPSSMDFSPCGSFIAIKNTQGQIVILDASSGDLVKDFKNQKEGEGSNVLFTKCGNYLLDGSWDGVMTLRSVSTGEVEFQREFEDEMITRIHLTNNKEMFISVHFPKVTPDKEPEDNYFLSWAFPMMENKPERMFFSEQRLDSSAFDTTGEFLAVSFGIPPNNLHVYEVKSQTLRWSKKDESARGADTLVWSPCGKYLGAVLNKCVEIYDGATGSLISRHELPYPSDIAFSPDGQLLAYGSWKAGEIRPFAI